MGLYWALVWVLPLHQFVTRKANSPTATPPAPSRPTHPMPAHQQRNHAQSERVKQDKQCKDSMSLKSKRMKNFHGLGTSNTGDPCTGLISSQSEPMHGANELEKANPSGHTRFHGQPTSISINA